MKVTALEVSLNGKLRYTVGMEGWSQLSAHVHGNILPSELLDEIHARQAEMKSDQPLLAREQLGLSCHVALPDPDRPSTSTGQSYGVEDLAVGDEIIIRIVETDSPDLPEPPPP